MKRCEVCEMAGADQDVYIQGHIVSCCTDCRYAVLLEAIRLVAGPGEEAAAPADSHSPMPASPFYRRSN